MWTGANVCSENSVNSLSVCWKQCEQVQVHVLKAVWIGVSVGMLKAVWTGVGLCAENSVNRCKCFVLKRVSTGANVCAENSVNRCKCVCVLKAVWTGASVCAESSLNRCRCVSWKPCEQVEVCAVFRIELVVLLMKEDLFTDDCQRQTSRLPEQEVHWVDYEEVRFQTGLGVCFPCKGVTVQHRLLLISFI